MYHILRTKGFKGSKISLTRMINDHFAVQLSSGIIKKLRPNNKLMYRGLKMP